MAASVTPGRALRYAGGSAQSLLHQTLGHCPIHTISSAAMATSARYVMPARRSPRSATTSTPSARIRRVSVRSLCSGGCPRQQVVDAGHLGYRSAANKRLSVEAPKAQVPQFKHKPRRVAAASAPPQRRIPSLGQRFPERVCTDPKLVLIDNRGLGGVRQAGICQCSQRPLRYFWAAGASWETK